MEQEFLIMTLLLIASNLYILYCFVYSEKGNCKKNGVFLIKGVTYTHNTLAGITDRHFTLYPNLCIFTHHAGVDILKIT